MNANKTNEQGRTWYQNLSPEAKTLVDAQILAGTFDRAKWNLGEATTGFCTGVFQAYVEAGGSVPPARAWRQESK